MLVDLFSCWRNEFENSAKILNQFFTPFVDFGVARYAAWAEALIALRPPFPEYEAWLNFAQKLWSVTNWHPIDRLKMLAECFTICRQASGRNT